VADLRGSTVNAGHETQSPTYGGSGGEDVFYKLTLTAPELVYVDTFGSTVDTTVYLIQSDCNGALVTGGGNDDSGCSGADGKASRFVATLQAGTYILAVDTARGASGNFTLRVSRSGAGCGGATLVTTSGVATNPESNCSGAGTSQLDPNPQSCVTNSAATGGERAFYFMTCPVSGGRRLAANTALNQTGTGTDTVLYARNFTCLAADAGCNDDTASGQYWSTISNIALGASGGIHYVVVDSYLDQSRCGNFQLSATVTP